MTYGDERMFRGAKYICIKCPTKTDKDSDIRPMVDIVVDPRLIEVRDLIRRVQGQS